MPNLNVGFLVCGALCLGAHAAEMVNVEYIHNAIKQKWDITVPYNAALENPRVAANMKYLLTAVDVANEILNGEKTTNYGNGEYATMQAADTIASIQAVESLVKFKPKFFMTTNTNVSVFKMDIFASGRFFIDWGDGQTEILNITDASDGAELAHSYATPGQYEIKMAGRATGYEASNAQAGYGTFVLYNTARKMESDIVQIRGSLGAIFPTIGDGSAPGSQPSFSASFQYTKNLVGPIPSELFDGVHGAPIAYMFENTFLSCEKLSGSIPKDLFAGISGAPATGMFRKTFSDCSRLTGQIPENLFAGITGASAPAMFHGTFYGCSGLTGVIPSGLFAGITGAPQNRMLAHLEIVLT